MLTRGAKKAAKKATLRVYRQRVKRSTCRRRLRGNCRRTATCKVARGTKRTFCRTKKNKKVRRNGSHKGRK